MLASVGYSLEDYVEMWSISRCTSCRASASGLNFGTSLPAALSRFGAGPISPNVKSPNKKAPSPTRAKPVKDFDSVEGELQVLPLADLGRPEFESFPYNEFSIHSVKGQNSWVKHK